MLLPRVLGRHRIRIRDHMNKRLFIKMLILLLITSFSTFSYANKTIRVTLQLPEKDSLGKNWNEFKKIVEKESNGSLKVLLFPSAQLFKEDQVPEAVGSGAIEAGSAFLGRFVGAVPAVDIINLPFLFDNEQALRNATTTNSPLRTILDEAILDETGAKVLWWQDYGRNVYLSKGDNVIRTPVDLVGKKVRTYGKVPSWTAQELRAVPIIISGSEQFIAYQQGVVDVGMTSASAVKSRKLYEVMDNMTLSFDSAIEFVAVINNEFFNDLTEAEQDIILNAAKTVEKQIRDNIYAEEAGSITAMREKMNVVDLTDPQRKQWQDATMGVIERFRKENGKVADEALKSIGK